MATIVNKLSIYFFVASISIFLCTILGKFGSHFWIFDLFSHFAVQYLCLAMTLLVVLLFWNKNNHKALAITAVTIALNIIGVAPFYSQKAVRLAPNNSIKIASINVHSFNHDWGLLKDYLDSYKPDVVTFFEITPEWGKKINTLKQVFPYGKAVLQNDNFGIGIISKFELSNIEIHRETSFETPFIAVDVKIFDRAITIVAAHPFPPIGSVGTQIRDNYLARVAEFIQKKKSPVILCGDLNISPWSPKFRTILESANLRFAEGHGVVATWPTYLPFLRIPIDHCLVSPSVRIISYSRGPHVGSDHYPLETEISLDSERIPTSNEEP